MISILLAALIATSDESDTITLTERILIEHCMNHKEDCSKEAKADVALAEQLERIYK